VRGGGGGKDPNLARRESLVLYKSFNTIWFIPSSQMSDSFVAFLDLIHLQISTFFKLYTSDGHLE
jgi:hypothetical protein